MKKKKSKKRIFFEIATATLVVTGIGYFLYKTDRISKINNLFKNSESTKIIKTKPFKKYIQ